MQRKIHKHPQHRTRFHSEYRGGKPYSEKNVHTSTVWGGWLLGYKMFCKNCKEAHKRNSLLDLCPICANELVHIAPRARLPRKNASKKEWNKFINLFTKKI